MCKKLIKLIYCIILIIVISPYLHSQKIDYSKIEHHSSRITGSNKFSVENISYKVIKPNTKVYTSDWDIKEFVSPDRKLWNCFLTETSDHYVLIGRDNFWINADDVAIDNSDSLSDDITYNQLSPGFEWVPIWYSDVIKCTGDDFKNIVYKNAPYLKNKWIDDSECYWYQDSLFSYPCVFRFQNTYFSFTVDGWGVKNFGIIKINKLQNKYYITCSAKGFYYDDYKGNINYLENFPRVNNDREFVLRLEYQKNHIHLYNNETDKLIVELMAVSKEWIKKLQHYFYTGNNPFISELPFSNVAPNKTMTVKENLKLRSGEATTTSVLAVMFTGTKVKILTLGKQATIDDITSNWVQVEVQAGAKDRDGKPIAAGTTGWCFGGYLTER